MRIGEKLVAEGVIARERLEEALDLQERWDMPLGEILMGQGWVRPIEFYPLLAEQMDLPFVNLLEEPPEPGLPDEGEIETYSEHGFLPWRREGGRLLVATSDPSSRVRELVRDRYGSDAELVVTSKFDVVWTLQERFERELTHDAVDGLAERRPEMSAKSVFATSQLLAFEVVALAVGASFLIAPIETAVWFNAAVVAFYFLTMAVRALLVWVGSSTELDNKITDEQVAAMRDEELPTYTVLAPLFREAEVLPELARALRRLDYPMPKLDVKIILEEEDEETIRAAKELGLESSFEIIRVPPSQPQTKPKACNYALRFARGELCTIYDAEDRPEPDQLKKVVAGFRQADPEVVCFQGRLNYYNADQNWLTRMFTLDYSLWFDFMLPGLELLGIPLPLGGTSNHFKMEVLRELGAWDPYNVTEDADLGIRLSQLGYRCETINSTTFEEANSRFGNWIRQRSRWIKGYMQTWLVHMRQPIKTYRTLGHAGFWGFQFFFGGSTFSVLVNPLLWGLFAVWLVGGANFYQLLFPPAVLYLSVVNLLAGNGIFIYLNLVGAFKRKNFRLIPWGVTIPVYWLMMSVAGYKGLWQLIHDPFFWEKTEHGLTDVLSDVTGETAAEGSAG